MRPYHHKVHYYETDCMGVTHHSNYIRWFEEARIDFLEQAGFGYDRMEALGICSPVLGVRAEYKKMTRFAEKMEISVSLVRFTGVRFTFAYAVRNEAGELCCRGETDHCFLDDSGRLLRLRDRFPEIYRLMQNVLQGGE